MECPRLAEAGHKSGGSLMPDQLLWLKVKIWHWVVDESGQDLIEYGLLVVLASLVAITLQTELAASIANMFTKVSTTLS